MARQVILLALVLVAALVVAGCSDDSTDPSATRSPTPDGPPRPGTPAPAPTRSPVKQDVVDEKSKRGVRAFGEYYYRLVNYGRATDDWGPVKEVTLPSCKQCRDFWSDNPERMTGRSKIDILRPGGLRFEGGAAIVNFFVTTYPLEKSPLQLGYKWLDSLTVEYRGHGWRVRELLASPS